MHRNLPTFHRFSNFATHAGAGASLLRPLRALVGSVTLALHARGALAHRCRGGPAGHTIDDQSRVQTNSDRSHANAGSVWSYANRGGLRCPSVMLINGGSTTTGRRVARARPPCTASMNPPSVSPGRYDTSLRSLLHFTRLLRSTSDAGHRHCVGLPCLQLSETQTHGIKQTQCRLRAEVLILTTRPALTVDRSRSCIWHHTIYATIRAHRRRRLNRPPNGRVPHFNRSLLRLSVATSFTAPRSVPRRSRPGPGSRGAAMQRALHSFSVRRIQHPSIFSIAAST